MVLHIAGLADNISRNKPVTIDIAQYQQPTKVRPIDTGRKDGQDGIQPGADLHYAEEVEKLARLKWLMIHASYYIYIYIDIYIYIHLCIYI